MLKQRYPRREVKNILWPRMIKMEIPLWLKNEFL
jgi:hypothetical protein